MKIMDILVLQENVHKGQIFQGSCFLEKLFKMLCSWTCDGEHEIGLNDCGDEEEVEQHHNWLCFKRENTNLKNDYNAVSNVVIYF